MDAETERHKDVARLLDLLAGVLRASGLVVAVGETGLVARNTREAAGATAVGKAMNPGLRQEIVCQRDASDELWWFWAWAGATRGAPPELEPLCQAEKVMAAAERIAHVL